MGLKPKLFAGLALSGLLSLSGITALSANPSLTLAGPSGAGTDITIYGGRHAQVQEMRTVTLQPGRNTIHLTGIPADFRPDSLRLVDVKGPGSFTYRSSTYQGANLTTENILAQYVGQDVEIQQQGSGNWVKGTLQAVLDDRYVLLLPDRVTAIVPKGTQIRLADAPKGLSPTSRLVIEAEVATAGSYQIAFMYETSGLAWSARHDAVFDEKRDRLSSWQTSVSIANSTGVSYDNATVRLISGGALGSGDGRRAAAAGRMAAPAASMDFSSEATVENVGDQKVYAVPGKVDLSTGQVRQIRLLEGKNVPVVKEYVVPSAQFGNGITAAQQNVTVRLTLDNSVKNNLGKPIPAGPVKIFQLNNDGVELQTGGARISSDKAADEVFTLTIGTASDVKYTRSLIDRVSDTAPPRVAGTAFEIQTWEVQIFNYKTDRDVAVKVEVYIPDGQDDVKPLIRQSANQAETKLQVSKGRQQSLQYKLRNQTR